MPPVRISPLITEQLESVLDHLALEQRGLWATALNHLLHQGNLPTFSIYKPDSTQGSESPRLCPQASPSPWRQPAVARIWAWVCCGQWLLAFFTTSPAISWRWSTCTHATATGRPSAGFRQWCILHLRCSSPTSGACVAQQLSMSLGRHMRHCSFRVSDDSQPVCEEAQPYPFPFTQLPTGYDIFLAGFECKCISGLNQDRVWRYSRCLQTKDRSFFQQVTLPYGWLIWPWPTLTM